MTTDLSMFTESFFEECSENIDLMEHVLLNLDGGHDSITAINSIFRGVHSIKGGAATFGFTEVAEFTHLLETLLDLMRSDKNILDHNDIDLLLDVVDHLRNMLADVQSNSTNDNVSAQRFKKRIEESIKATLCQVTVPCQLSEGMPAVSGSDVFSDDEFESLLDSVHAQRNLKTSTIHNHSSGLSEGKVVLEFDKLFWKDKIQESMSQKVRELARSAAGTNQIAQTARPESFLNKKPGGTGSASIRVASKKIDELVDLVGELVITQSNLRELMSNFNMSKIDKLVEGLALLERSTREFQQSVMNIKMLPISFVFNRFPRLVRDLGQSLGKSVRLKLSGESTELHKSVIEKISAPLVHLVRNSIDHGIEDRETRLARGKPETGLIHLKAYQNGYSIIIEIRDDGAGLNRVKILKKAVEKNLVENVDDLTDEVVYDLIFQPGFSTADVVSDVSGRGVGMDVVRRNINDLGGSVVIHSEQGKGTLFTICLPLTQTVPDFIKGANKKNYQDKITQIPEFDSRISMSFVKG